MGEEDHREDRIWEIYSKICLISQEVVEWVMLKSLEDLEACLLCTRVEGQIWEIYLEVPDRGEEGISSRKEKIQKMNKGINNSIENKGDKQDHRLLTQKKR